MPGKKTLTKQDIQHIAQLSRLSVSDKEVGSFASQLSAVIDYFSKLAKVDTKSIKPTYQSIPNENRFQEQRISSDTLPQKDVLKNAPEKKDGYVVTEAVLP